MIAGAVGTIVVTSVLALNTTTEGMSYYSWALLLSFIGIFGGMTFSPWMASFTETVEKHNPAATATGLAVWGWIIRIVAAGSSACIPIVVSAVTPLVDYGPQVQALASQYPSEIATVSAIDPATLNTLNADPTNSTAIAKAVGEVSQAQHVTPAAALNQLVAVSKVPKQDLQYLQTYGPTVQQAQQDVPGQWQTWWWVCVGCQIAFIPFVFVMAGRWSPRKAREDAELHDQLVAPEIAKLTLVGLSVPAAATATIAAARNAEVTAASAAPGEQEH
ncbi:MAG: hypothetical protein ACXV5Q_16495 [Frankiaceae bacterium]